MAGVVFADEGRTWHKWGTLNGMEGCHWDKIGFDKGLEQTTWEEAVKVC